MEWFIFIVIVLVVWYFFSQWKKSTPESKMKVAEEHAYEQYYKVLETAKKSLTEYEEHRKTGKYLMGKEENDNMIKLSKKCVDDYEDVESMYVRLKERLKHKPAKEQLEIYIDFYNFTFNLTRLDRRFEQLNYDFGENAYEKFDEDVKGPRIQNEEIVKRFKDKLK